VDNKHNFQQGSKFLKGQLSKRFKTTIIGLIATMEDYFGKYWGHDKYEDELTDQEKRIKEIWDDARTEMLDKGNDQMRGALGDVDHCNVTKKKYNYNFKVRGSNDYNR
jgi:hypothetical protein